MKLLGAAKVSDLGPKFVSSFSFSKKAITHTPQINSRAVERDVYDGNPGLEKLGLWVQARL